MNENLVVNNDKNNSIVVNGIEYLRFAVKTHVITKKDNICEVANRYASPYIKKGDLLFISEKAVACTQNRAIPLKDIKARPLAKLLCRFVLKTPHGIGLGIPETMEMALRECGTIKIIFAAFISAIGKIFRKRGWFYKIAGTKAQAIDGPCEYTLPPYNEYVVLAPVDPDKTALEIAQEVGCDVAIVDINDLAGNILGTSSDSINRDELVQILKDNPLGQSTQQTPMGILRSV